MWLRQGWTVVACLAAAWSVGTGHPRAAAGGGAADDHRDVVVVGVSPARAGALATAAAVIRGEITAALCGEAAMTRWSPPCVVHVHGDRASFARAVPGAPVASGGATSIEFVGDTISLRRIDVVDDPDGGVPPALAHELVHVVLADRFTSAPPPRWADEGLATLFDQPAKQRGHDADFRAAADRGQDWGVADLMGLELDPADAARQRVFYGQSASLVRWLLARRDGPTLLRFLEDAAQRGPVRALAAHYDIDSPAALEREWRASPVTPPGPPINADRVPDEFVVRAPDS